MTPCFHLMKGTLHVGPGVHPTWPAHAPQEGEARIRMTVESGEGGWGWPVQPGGYTCLPDHASPATLPPIDVLTLLPAWSSVCELRSLPCVYMYFCKVRCFTVQISYLQMFCLQTLLRRVGKDLPFCLCSDPFCVSIICFICLAAKTNYVDLRKREKGGS